MVSSVPPAKKWHPFWPHRCPSFHSLRLTTRAFLAQPERDKAAHRGVVIGVSGGADSLALAAACLAERVPTHVVVVDHSLQAGSADVAAEAIAQLQSLQQPMSAEIIRVDIPSVSGGAGPEALARRARHDVLRGVAKRLHRPLLLAHTLDDQAETMLLRLARGGGPHAISAIREHMQWSDGVDILRPLLQCRREQTSAACAELGLVAWADPQNTDRKFARVRVRHQILPLLERELGPGVAENLAKTAELAALDNDALDDWAARGLIHAETPPSVTEKSATAVIARLSVADVVKQPPAIQSRMLRDWIHNHHGTVGSAQLNALSELLHNYHGQGAISLPKSAPHDAAMLVVSRKGGTLALSKESDSKSADPN